MEHMTGGPYPSLEACMKPAHGTVAVSAHTRVNWHCRQAFGPENNASRVLQRCQTGQSRLPNSNSTPNVHILPELCETSKAHSWRSRKQLRPWVPPSQPFTKLPQLVQRQMLRYKLASAFPQEGVQRQHEPAQVAHQPDQFLWKGSDFNEPGDIRLTPKRQKA